VEPGVVHEIAWTTKHHS